MPSIVPPPLGRLRVFYILSSIHLKNTACGQVFAKPSIFIVAQTVRFVKPPDGNTQGCLIKKIQLSSAPTPERTGRSSGSDRGGPSAEKPPHCPPCGGSQGDPILGGFSFPSFSLSAQRKRGKRKTAQDGIPLGTPTWWTVGRLLCGRAAPVGAGGTSRPLGGRCAGKLDLFYETALGVPIGRLHKPDSLCYNKNAWLRKDLTAGGIFQVYGR